MKQVWLTEDGATFDHYIDAERHEHDRKLYAGLYSFFEAHIPYCSDAGGYCADASDIAQMIIDNISDFQAVFTERSSD